MKSCINCGYAKDLYGEKFNPLSMKKEELKTLICFALPSFIRTENRMNEPCSLYIEKEKQIEKQANE